MCKTSLSSFLSGPVENVPGCRHDFFPSLSTHLQRYNIYISERFSPSTSSSASTSLQSTQHRKLYQPPIHPPCLSPYPSPKNTGPSTSPPPTHPHLHQISKPSANTPFPQTATSSASPPSPPSLRPGTASTPANTAARPKSPTRTLMPRTPKPKRTRTNTYSIARSARMRIMWSISRSCWLGCWWGGCNVCVPRSSMCFVQEAGGEEGRGVWEGNE